MRALLRIVIVFIFIFCCQGVFSFPAPEIQLPTAAAKFNISNTLTKTIYSWTDNRGTIYKQVDQAQQPNLVSVRNKNVVSFAPKSVLQSKSLTGPFVFPSAKFQLVALVSLFVRTERNTTVPFTFFTDSNDALTLQYEYDTKCFGFYWKNRGVQVCANDLVSGVNVGELNATLLFASLDKNLISLRIGGMSVENQVVEEFTGMNGWLVLGGSPYTASPFYGVIHSLDVYNSLLTDAEKFALHMQHIREYQLTAGSWQFWNYDTTYTKDFLALSRYAGKQVREGSSSAQFQITDVNALDSTDDVAASLCVAHNSSDALKWQANTGFGLMYVLNRHWKVIYVPGSSGLGHVNITVKDLSTVINGTSMPLTICYKENQSDKQCSLYSAVTGDTFNVVPRTGYYYLTLGTTCSVNTDCDNFVKPVNATCNFECYQQKCYCMDRETSPIDEEPQGDEAVVIDPPRALGLWIYPLAIMLSVVVFAVAIGVRQWIKSRRDRVVVERVTDSVNEEAIMTQN